MALALPGSINSALAALPTSTSDPFRLTSKTLTFTGAAGNGAIGTVAVFTAAGGAIVVKYIAGRVTTSLTGASATMTLGTTHQAALFIGTTTATTLTTSAELWASTTATQGGIALPAITKEMLIDENVIITVAVAAVATGVLEIDCLWVPLTSGATLS